MKYICASKSPSRTIGSPGRDVALDDDPRELRASCRVGEPGEESRGCAAGGSCRRGSRVCPAAAQARLLLGHAPGSRPGACRAGDPDSARRWTRAPGGARASSNVGSGCPSASRCVRASAVGLLSSSSSGSRRVSLGGRQQGLERFENERRSRTLWRAAEQTADPRQSLVVAERRDQQDGRVRASSMRSCRRCRDGVGTSPLRNTPACDDQARRMTSISRSTRAFRRSGSIGKPDEYRQHGLGVPDTARSAACGAGRRRRPGRGPMAARAAAAACGIVGGHVLHELTGAVGEPGVTDEAHDRGADGRIGSRRWASTAAACGTRLRAVRAATSASAAAAWARSSGLGERASR